jgi:AraC-like DNA-binding protein
MDIAAGVSAAFVVGEALMLVALLLADGSRRRDHRWLAVALVCAAASSLEDVIEHFSLTRSLAWVLPFTGPGLLVVGPAMYLYARSITEAHGAKPARVWLHFIPAAVVLVLSLALVPHLDDTQPPQGRPVDSLVALVPVALQLAAYLVAIARQVLRTRARLRHEVSTLDGRALSWLLVVAGLYGLVLVTWIVSWAASVAQSDLLTNVLIGVSLCITGAFGVRQRNVFEPRDGRHSVVEPQPSASSKVALASPASSASTVEAPAAKYARSAIDGVTAAALRTRLIELMATDKPYLEADLSLADLASRIQTTPHQLSQLFTQHLGETFFDFVNRYRVEAVKATLTRPGAEQRPLLEIAFECGFGSKSTFNDTFRRLTGVSPSQFRRAMPLPPSV